MSQAFENLALLEQLGHLIADAAGGRLIAAKAAEHSAYSFRVLTRGGHEATIFITVDCLDPVIEARRLYSFREELMKRKIGEHFRSDCKVTHLLITNEDMQPVSADWLTSN